MRKLTLLIILVATAAVALAQEPPKPASAQSDAQKAFEKMKTLAGSWEGSVMGMSVQLTIRVTSTGNAIMSEATGSGRPDDPITMFYVDEDRLLLTHASLASSRRSPERYVLQTRRRN